MNEMSKLTKKAVFYPAIAQVTENEVTTYLVSAASQSTEVGTTDMNTYSWSGEMISNADIHTVGITKDSEGNNNVNRMYLKFTMPTLPRNPRIRKAELTLTQAAALNQADALPKFGIYKVAGELAAGDAAPDAETKLVDYNCMRSEADEEAVKYIFDITALLNVADSQNFVLKFLDETMTEESHLAFCGASDTANPPEISITYESSYGVNSSYRTNTHDLGRFGTGSIDLQCGNLMFESEDFAWGSNHMPVTIKHLYNSALSEYQYTKNSVIGLDAADFSAMKLGLGWKLNVMQSMVAATFQQEGVTYDGYAYTDENGETIFFKVSEDEALNEETGASYYLYEDIEGSEMKYDPKKLTLVQGEETYLFDADGRLIKITDAYGNQMQLAYYSGKLSYIVDGAGRYFRFGYNSDGFLTIVSAPGGAYIQYAYTDDYLTQITYEDGRKVSLSYESGKPLEVFLQNLEDQMYKVVYSFEGDQLSTVSEFAVAYEEVDGTTTEVETRGNSTSYNCSPVARTTTVVTTEPMDVDEGETSDLRITTVYTFDEDGEVVSQYAYGENEVAAGLTGEAGGIHPYYGDGEVNAVSNSCNLLREHQFNDLMYWTGLEGNAADFVCSVCETEAAAVYGKKVLCMKSSDSTCTANGVSQSTVELPAGEYTFSAYVCIPMMEDGTENPEVYLRVKDANGAILSQSEHFATCDSEYTRLVLPFIVPADTALTVEILVDGAGSVYVNAPQLENNAFANSYNMLEEGNFEFRMQYWEASNATYTSEESFNMDFAAKVNGNLDAKAYVSQEVPVKSSRFTRETFALSGWAKGSALPIRTRENTGEAQFRLRAVIQYYDSTTETFCADFAPCTDEWQYASVQFAKSKCQRIEKLTVYCDYDHNDGAAYFDDIQLVRDSIETNLTYEDFVGNEELDEEDIAENEVEIVDEAAEFEELKDAFGNTLTETVFTDGEFGTIYRAFGFDTKGNHLIAETDSRGNKTEYQINASTSRNEEATDYCGNKTAYEYDSSGRLTKVTCKDSADNELASVSYTYNAYDNMSQIVRGDGLKYVMNYNAFHNLESIGVDGKTEKLVSYTYKNGNGRLKQIAYANGDVMKVTYNRFGQMTSEKWYNSEGSLTASYKYGYDNQGNIVRCVDLKLKKEYNYVYENGQLVRATEYDIVISTNDMVFSKTVVNTIFYRYDAEGVLVRKQVVPAIGDAQVIYYENKEESSPVVKFTAGEKQITSHSKTDSFGRKEFDEIQLGTGFVSRQFAYHAGQITTEHQNNGMLKSTATTNLVSQITFSDGRTIAYEYDAEERITKVIDSVDGTTEYTYDALGQLLTEKVNGQVVNTMTYDNYGNILSKNGVAYTYGDSVWKDKLTAYGDQTTAYDAQGNPTTYLGHSLTWEKGRQLKSFDSNTYTYNANGIRTSKTVNGVKHTYTLDGTNILKETRGENILVPLYDNEENVCGIIYNEEPYYFHRNLQDDVIAIADQNANVVARYQYDAWGVCSIVADTTECGIAEVNPYRYRGYYFDVETGLYYIFSRYYNPSIGRFISVDKVMGANDELSTYDLYAYCGNSPVDRYDKGGLSWKKTWKKIKSTVRTALNKSNKVLLSYGIDTALVGSFFLNMYKDKKGIYHAKFNCWQQFFGYNDFYDFMFDIGTSMKERKFKFKSGKKWYVLWAWKGNYINLGAGAELGIYYNNYGGAHWFVDKELAMQMHMTLRYKNSKIISYSKKTWWITGFNPKPKYLDVKASDLKARFEVEFSKNRCILISRMHIRINVRVMIKRKRLVSDFNDFLIWRVS